MDFLTVLCNLTKNFGLDYFTKFPPLSKAATTTNSMTKTVTSSLNKMTLNPNASSWTPNQFLSKGSSSSTSRPGFETSRPEFESYMPGFESSRTGFESWVDASEFVPESSKPKLRPLTKTNSDVERNTEGAAGFETSRPEFKSYMPGFEEPRGKTRQSTANQKLRPIIIDGQNVAIEHGKEVYSGKKLTYNMPAHGSYK